MWQPRPQERPQPGSGGAAPTPPSRAGPAPRTHRSPCRPRRCPGGGAGSGSRGPSPGPGSGRRGRGRRTCSRCRRRRPTRKRSGTSPRPGAAPRTAHAPLPRHRGGRGRAGPGGGAEGGGKEGIGNVGRAVIPGSPFQCSLCSITHSVQKFFPTYPSLLQLEVIYSCPVAGCLGKEVIAHLPTGSSQVDVRAVRSPLNLLFSRLNNPNSLSSISPSRHNDEPARPMLL